MLSGTYDPGVIPLVLTVAGLLALGVAAAILRSFGPRYRVGRLLAVAPKVGVAEALRLVESGETAYVRVDGRIDSEEEFEDEHHRPLVLRRTTLRWRRPGGRGAWATIEPTTERVTFTVREGMDEIGIEGDDLREGLTLFPDPTRSLSNLDESRTSLHKKGTLDRGHAVDPPFAR